jgi:anti-sigma factor RsiW
MTPDECQEVFSRLSEYLDRDLPADLCDRIDAHIRDCPPCVQFVESLRKSTELCREFLARESPGPLPEAMRKELLEAYQSLGLGT